MDSFLFTKNLDNSKFSLSPPYLSYPGDDPLPDPIPIELKSLYRVWRGRNSLYSYKDFDFGNNYLRIGVMIHNGNWEWISSFARPLGRHYNTYEITSRSLNEQTNLEKSLLELYFEKSVIKVK